MHGTTVKIAKNKTKQTKKLDRRFSISDKPDVY
jgi:hypothetical protein